MITLLKNLLMLALIIALGGVMVLGYKFTESYDRVSSPTNFRSFTVQGDGKAVGVPDIASFSFDVITEGGVDVAALQSQKNKAIEFVTTQGIDKKDIATSLYTIQPRYEVSNCNYGSGKVCPPPAIVGYTVQQSTAVKVRNFKTVSTLLSGVVTNGANTVSSLQFSIDDNTALETIARTAAIKKAQEKAQSVAVAGGFKLGKLLEISESFSIPYAQPRMMKVMEDGVEDAAVTPTVEAGSQEININVSLRYEIN
jgi:uncharacterized protein YggE